MHKPRGEAGSEIEYYAASDVTAGALTLLNHPVLHSARVLNHRRAEGIDVDGLAGDIESESTPESD
ncbi:MAG: hypothetical protein ACI8U4_003076 [Natronomonas sp.]|jgi:hypothetical protein